MRDAFSFNDREHATFVRLDNSFYDRIQCGESLERRLMKRVHRTSKLFVSGLCVLWLSLAGRQAAQSPA